MEIVVIWSDSAIEDLRDIYNYFILTASKKIADKITNAIVDRTILLEQAPRIGQREELLMHLHEEIRYLVDGNYKIVYLIDENLVTVLTIFDCRQNPKKLESKDI